MDEYIDIDKTFENVITEIQADHNGKVLYGNQNPGYAPDWLSGDKADAYAINAINSHEALRLKVAQLEGDLAIARYYISSNEMTEQG
jgi:hypothetical protein